MNYGTAVIIYTKHTNRTTTLNRMYTFYSNMRVMDDMTMFLNKVILLSSLTNTISHGSDNNSIHTNIPLQK